MSQTYEDKSLTRDDRIRAKFAELWEQAASRHKAGLTKKEKVARKENAEPVDEKENHAA